MTISFKYSVRKRFIFSLLASALLPVITNNIEDNTLVTIPIDFKVEQHIHYYSNEKAE